MTYDAWATEPPATVEPEWDLVIEDDEFGRVHPGDSFDLFDADGRESVLGRRHITVGELVDHLERGLAPAEVTSLRSYLKDALASARVASDNATDYPRACGMLQAALEQVLGRLERSQR